MPRTAAAHLAGHLPPQADGRCRQCIVRKQCPGQHRNRSLPSQWRSQRQWQTGQGSTLSPRQRMLPVVSPKWPRSKAAAVPVCAAGADAWELLGAGTKAVKNAPQHSSTAPVRTKERAILTNQRLTQQAIEADTGEPEPSNSMYPNFTLSSSCSIDPLAQTSILV